MSENNNEYPQWQEEDTEDLYSYEQQRKSFNRSGGMRARQNRRNKTKKTVLIVLLSAVLLTLWIVAAVSIVRYVMKDVPEPAPDTGSESESGDEPTGEGTDVGTEEPAERYIELKMSASDVKTGKLILINAAYPFDPDADKKLTSELVSVNQYRAGGYSVAYNTELLRMDTVSAMNEMFTAFTNETGLSGYSIRKDYTYCTAEQQKNWYESTVKNRGAADASSYEFKAGESEHEAGRTFDIKVEDNKGGSAPIAASDEAYRWIYDNCWKYGIVRRYPSDKKQATGVNMAENSVHYDHFRYVGKAAAAVMHANNWCLEEFLVEIQSYRQNGDHLTITDAEGKTTYEMYYFPAQKTGDTAVLVPEERSYEISGDNMGGFVVTMTVAIK